MITIVLIALRPFIRCGATPSLSGFASQTQQIIKLRVGFNIEATSWSGLSSVTHECGINKTKCKMIDDWNKQIYLIKVTKHVNCVEFGVKWKLKERVVIIPHYKWWNVVIKASQHRLPNNSKIVNPSLCISCPFQLMVGLSHATIPLFLSTALFWCISFNFSTTSLFHIQL